MIKYVFWDFNGTILDDRVICHNLLNELLVKEGKEKISYEQYLEVFGFPIKEYYMKAGLEFKYESFEEMGTWFIEMYQPLSLKQSLYDGVEKTLIKLEKLGIKSICLSASEQNNLLEQLKHYKIDHYFSKILGTNNVLALGKVDVARKYIKENNIDPKECLLIGDTDADYKLAKELGFMPLLFTNGHQSKKRLEVLDALTIDKIKDLIKIIKKERGEEK